MPQNARRMPQLCMNLVFFTERFLTQRFSSGDGEIDVDEFEYVLSNFNVSPKDCRAAFMMFSMVSERERVCVWRERERERRERQRERGRDRERGGGRRERGE